MEEFDGETVTYSDYNGAGGAGRYTIGSVRLADLAPHVRFVHYESPPPADGAFRFASPLQVGKYTDRIGKREPLGPLKFLRSPNGVFRLFRNDGEIALYDDSYRVRWRARVARRGGYALGIEGRWLRLWTMSGRVVRSWNIGRGAVVRLRDNGTLVAVRAGGEKVIARPSPVRASAR